MEPSFISIWIDKGSTHRACLVRKTGGKGLVEPKVVPPLHSDEVTEPHVAELVLDHNAEESELRDGHVLLRAHNFVAISDAADVFHGAIFVIWAHDMIDFCERIACAKVALVEIQSRLSDAEHELVAEILNKRLAHKDTLGHVHGIVVLKHKVGASTDCVEISRDLGGLFELIDRNLAFIIVQA